MSTTEPTNAASGCTLPLRDRDNQSSFKETGNMRLSDESRLAGIERRFWSFVAIADDDENCWLWKGGLTGGKLPYQRYGYFRPTWKEGDRSNDYAHRVAFILTCGPIPEGQNVLHRCDVPLCVNPAHLFTGSQKENVEDQVRKNRHTYGSRNGCAILTESDVVNILALRQQGMIHQDIASRYGVNRATITMALLGRTWKHVARPRSKRLNYRSARLVTAAL